MAHAYAEKYTTPEEAIEALKRGKTIKLALTIAALVAGLVAMIGFSAAMYSDEPDAARPAVVK